MGKVECVVGRGFSMGLGGIEASEQLVGSASGPSMQERTTVGIVSN